MTATVTRLPSASPCYITVAKAGRAWSVLLVTPAPLRPLRTTLARCTDRDQAIAFAEKSAADIKRPFKMGRAGR